MPQRTITGPIVDAGGFAIAAGELHVTPQIPAGEATDGFVVKTRRYPIADGEVAATIVVPGAYRFDVKGDEGVLLRSFTANVSGEYLTDISLKEVWESRAEPLELPPGAIREGDSILRLGPGPGTDWLMLSRHGDELLWRSPPSDGDMRIGVYDPHQRVADVYDRANHTGTQDIGTISGLGGMLGMTEYASVCDLKTSGTGGGSCTGGADTLRTFNTVRFNNSGLADSALLNASNSSVELLPGRVYYGRATAAAAGVSAHFLIVKSTDATVSISGGVEDASDASVEEAKAVVEFRIAVPSGGGSKRIQLYHRCRLTRSDTGLGVPGMYPGVPREFASMTLFSRPS